MIPRPVLVDGPFLGGQRGGGLQVLIEEGVVLNENAQFLVLGIVHAFHHVLHMGHFVGRDVQLGPAGFPGLFGLFEEIGDAPGCDAVGVPVVIDVVLVLVGAGHAVDHVLALPLGEVAAVGIEPGDATQHVQSFLDGIFLVAGVGGVVENGVSDGAVAVDLLEGDFPLVMALDAGKGHHGIQRALQALLPGVEIRAVQLQIAVQKQLTGHVLTGHGHVDRQAVGFGVPIGRAAVLFAGEALGSDIQPRVLAGVGAQQLEQVEADALLGRVVAFDGHIAGRPALLPGFYVLLLQVFIARFPGAAGRLHRHGHQQVFLVIPVGEAQGELFQRNSFPGGGLARVSQLHVTLVQLAFLQLQLIGPAAQARSHGEAGCAEGILLRLGQKGQCVLGLLLLQHIPEGLVIVAVQIAHIRVQIGLHDDVGFKLGRDGIVDRQQLLLCQRNKAFRLYFDLAVGRPQGEMAGKNARLHIQFPAEVQHIRLGQIQRLAVDLHMDAVQAHGVDDLAEVLGIAVLPPAHASLVREPHAADVGAQMGIAAVVLLKIAAHSHIAVPSGGQAFGQAHFVRLKARFDHFPGMDLVCHESVLLSGAIVCIAGLW